MYIYIYIYIIVIYNVYIYIYTYIYIYIFEIFVEAFGPMRELRKLFFYTASDGYPSHFKRSLSPFRSTCGAKFHCHVDSACPFQAPRGLQVLPRASQVLPQALKIIGFP